MEERTISGNRNARRRGDQQREEQERKGASTRRSLSLEVLVGNVILQVIRTQVVLFLLYSFEQVVGRISWVMKQVTVGYLKFESQAKVDTTMSVF
ncbi:hypothetical protein TNCV_1260181 [Trichonephila clavipes]|nr:hypothetical protein TNCV_1260181 [Trichonephila clavipes]